MRINREILNDINEIVEKFPDVEWFFLVESQPNGIGTCLSLEFQTTVNGENGRFVVELTDESDW